VVYTLSTNFILSSGKKKVFINPSIAIPQQHREVNVAECLDEDGSNGFWGRESTMAMSAGGC